VFSTNPNHSPTLATMKEINSTSAETSTGAQLVNPTSPRSIARSTASRHRITEKFWLERTSGGHLVQNPA